MSNITELKVNLSKYINPDDDYNIKPVNPDVPDTSDKDVDTGDHGFFTISDTSSSDTSTYQNIQTVSVVAFISFALILLFGLLLPKVVRKVRSQDSERYDLKRSHVSRLSFFSTIFASLSLLVGLVSSVVAYNLPTVLDTKVSANLTIDADIIGTNNSAYVHDTIIIPASAHGYNLYISTDDSEDNRLIGDSTDDIINSITTDGALTDGSYGFTFDNPTSGNATFHPIQKKDSRTKVLSLTPDKTTKEQHIDIWYGVKAKDLDESVYSTKIEYTTIDEHDLTLQEMTPEICATLEEGILGYTFKSSIDGKDYSVYKLKDGNCWTKETPSAPVDPENPDADIPTVCPTGWHEAKNENYISLDVFYPDSTVEQINSLRESSCVADFESALVTFDANGVDVSNLPDPIHIPNDNITITDFIYTITTPPALETDATCQGFLGWSLLPDATTPLYQADSQATFSSPSVTLYAVWSNAKTPKAILDSNGLLDFVYDYCSVETLEDENSIIGRKYRTNYEANLDNNATITNIYEVPPNAGSPASVPWLKTNARGASVPNPDILEARFEDSFRNFEPTSTAYWFKHLTSITAFTNLENLNTEKTTDMKQMFSNAYSLSSIELPEGFGSAVTNVSSMFASAASLTSIEFPTGFGSQATNMSDMFYFYTRPALDAFASNDNYCKTISSLESVTFPVGFGSKESNSVSMYGMFMCATALTSINLPEGFGSETTNMGYMFSHNYSLESLYLPANFGKKARNMSVMFTDDRSLRSINSPNGENTLPAGFGATEESISMDYMFHNTKALTSLEFPAGFGQSVGIIDYMFSGTGLNSIELPYGFGVNATSMKNMFNNTNKLTSLSLPENFGLNVIYTNNMFAYTNLSSITLPKNFGANAKEMQSMFSSATKLTTLELPDNFGANAEEMQSMFSGASKLSTIKSTKGDNVLPDGFGQIAVNLSGMFSSTSALTSISLPDYFGTRATDIGLMFSNTGLTSLELPEGFGNLATTTWNMFRGASNLQHIYVPANTNWATKTPAVSSSSSVDMFKGASNLPGYNASIVDIAAAHISSGSDDIGYFEKLANTDSGNSINPAPISGNSISPSYTPSIVEPVAEPEDTTTTTPSTVPTTNNPQEGNAEPQGVIRREQTDRTDYALIIVVATSITLVFLGALTIYFIEKRDRDEENIDKY